ncbi:MAG: chitobiase/beta-hexosaminidase C-terminal domain-containing protein [Prevotella sp.]|nr:chitobiase/beta-hexosaminidase C-terminal domain-containing protein [Prevotella sp.]
MKKFFTLTIMALLMAVGANAQEKKTWDFSKGWSDETIANLTAGSEWTLEGTSWKETGKFGSGGFVANGKPIKELEGLERSSAGLSGSNNYLLTPTTFRLNRAKQELKFPSLKNGQKLTVVGRSANGTAPNRGVLPMYDYMVRVDDDPTNEIMLGGNVEGSKGTYTFIYEIRTNEAGEVPVGIKMNSASGGIDFTLFMIDEGDEIKTANVAYLYNGTEDVVLNYLNAREYTKTTPVNVTTATVTADELRGYDVVVVGASVPADNAAVAAVKEAMPWTPVLNLNGNLYAAWGYGEAVGSLGYVKIKSTKNVLFSGVEYTAADEGNVLVLANTSEDVEAQAVNLGEYFAGDEILGTTLDEEATTFIHTHNIKHNGYLYLPYVDNYSDAALQALNNAITMLFESKSDITAAPAPSISQEFKDQATIVTLTPGRTLPKTQIYYTTDGSAPTLEAATLYTEPFTLTATGTVKAIAIAEGYTVSDAASADIAIYSQPKTPSISYEQEDGKTTITLACETPDAQIWYNFETTASTDTTKSSKYTEPFVITMPQNVNVFAVAGETVWSEIASQRILVKNPRVVIDVAAHFSAPAWDGIGNGSGLFTGAKNATSMYVEGTGEQQTVNDPETGDEKTIWVNQEEVEYETKDEPGENPQWTVMTKGQAVLWQNNGASTDKIGTDYGGYYPETSADISSTFAATKNDIQFSKTYSGEHANAAIQSKNRYQAPLDVIVLANMQGGPLLAQVSADGENWTTIGDEIAKTGWTRMWKMYTRSYNGTDEVYVRVTQQTGDASAKIFDIYIANQGEQSLALLQQLNEELTGIADVKQAVNVAEGIYNLSGMRQNGLKTGLNIVVKDGVVRKIIVK